MTNGGPVVGNGGANGGPVVGGNGVGGVGDGGGCRTGDRYG